MDVIDTGITPNNENYKIKKSYHNFLFKELDLFFRNLSLFVINVINYLKEIFHSQESIFELFFTLVYFIEQLGLFLFFVWYPDVDAEIVIGIFILILLTTKAFEKISLQSRNKRLRDDLISLSTSFEIQRSSFEENYQDLANEYNLLNESHSELLKEYEKATDFIEKNH